MTQFDVDFAESSTPVAANQVVTGTPHDALGLTPTPQMGTATGQARFRALAAADQAGTLAIEQSSDQATWYETISVPLPASTTRSGGNPTATVLESIVTLRYVRARVFNGAVDQTTLKFASSLVAV